MSFANSLLRLMFWALAVNLIAAPLSAAEQLNFNQANFASQLYQAQQVELAATPLDKGRTADLALEKFQLFAPDAKITVHSAHDTKTIPLPQTHYFQGSITGNTDSAAFMAVDADGKTRSILQMGGQIYVNQNNTQKPETATARALLPEQDFKQKNFQCEVDGNKSFKAPLPAGVKARINPVHAEGTNDLTYIAELIIETDYEFYSLFNNASAAAQYVSDLIAYVSTIYEAEINTQLSLKEIVLYSSPNDPWTAETTSGALSEVQAYYLAKRADVTRTTVHFLSSKETMNGGIAFISSICTAPSYGGTQGSYDFGVSGGISGSFTPNSPLIVWDAYVVAHELGHNFGSSHTHAYDVDHGYSLPIDCCYATAGGVCQNYQPATNLPGLGTLTGGTTATHPGTIMSYCHLVSGGSQNVSMTFGKNHLYGVEAHRVPEVMRTTVEAYAAVYPQCFAFNLTSNNPFGFASVSKWHESFVANQSTPLIGDFNGDRLTDVASFAQYSSHKVFVSLSNGSALMPKTLWRTHFALGQEAAVGDFNGDGKSDLISFSHNDQRQIYVSLSNGISFAEPSLWFSLKTAQDGAQVIGDFNGDGKDDIATLKRARNLIFVSLSNGSSLGMQSQWSSDFDSMTKQIVVGDFNGDHKADLGFSFSTGEFKVSLSTGTSFSPATLWHSSLAASVTQLVVGDFNADGKDDIASYLPTEFGGIYLAFAENGQFGTNQKAHAWFAPYDQIIKAGYFNNDRASDVISFTRGSTADVWLATDLKE